MSALALPSVALPSPRLMNRSPQKLAKVGATALGGAAQAAKSALPSSAGRSCRSPQARRCNCSRRLAHIPIRVGASGGVQKISAILGALTGGHTNVLMTDEDTAALLGASL